ncbi:MAG: CPBP family intramembrane glutamic endopeptidase [Candidatus Helarchaeota archaeon]
MVTWQDNIDLKRIIVLGTVILLTIAYYFLALAYIPISPTQKNLIFFQALFGWLPLADFWQYIFQFVLAFLFFFIIPVLLIRFYFKEDLKDYGFSLKERKLILIFSVLAVAIMVPLAIYQSMDVTFQLAYPMSKLVVNNIFLLIIYETCYVVFYYLSYETIFRGFLQFGLKREDTTNKGLWLIIAIQTVITVLFHIGKPIMEIMGALIAGIIFGYIALKAKSIYPVLLGHALLGVVLDVCSVFWSVIP